MSNASVTSSTFNPLAAPAGGALLAELFRATPLYIFAAAVQLAVRRPAKD